MVDPNTAMTQTGDTMPYTQHFDVAIIGGGVLGTAVAERLTRTSLAVCLFESENDVGEQASKGNAGNTVSYYGAPGQQTDLINLSNPLWEEITTRLNVPFRRSGALMVAFDDHEIGRLERTLEEMMDCGVTANFVDGDMAREIEPLLSPKVVRAISMPNEGIIDPMRLTVAYANLAVMNGLTLFLGEPVTGIRKTDSDKWEITTDSRVVTSRYLINAAGVRAGYISELAGGENLEMWPRKGQYAVLDRAFGHKLKRIVFSTHQPDTKGTNVVPTTHGSVLLGPTAENHDDYRDKSTDAHVIEEVIRQGIKLVPAVETAYVLKTFAANRPASDEPHRLRLDGRMENLIHVTDRSAGVSLSPAAAEMVANLLHQIGLDFEDQPNKQNVLPKIFQMRTTQTPELAVQSNPLYGQIVCVCENVSAAEIESALTSPVPACSVDGVRKRTGASYGRCQGSLCLAGITFLTALHSNKGPTDVRQTSEGTLGS